MVLLEHREAVFVALIPHPIDAGVVGRKATVSGQFVFKLWIFGTRAMSQLPEQNKPDDA